MKQIKTLDDVYVELRKREVSIYDKYSYVHPKKTKNKVINTTLGLIWFNILLPDNYPEFVNEQVNKSKLNNEITQIIYEICSPQEACDCLSLILKEGFDLATLLPQTFCIDDLEVPKELLNERDRELTKDTSPEEFNEKLSLISDKYFKYKEDQGSQLINIIKSGAKSSKNDLNILAISRGPAVDIENNVLPNITSSLLEGYTIQEYYDSAAEARKGYYIRAVGTAQPGALSREIIFANANITLSDKDCKTKKYLELFIKESMGSGLIGRYYLNEKTNELIKITSSNFKNVINKNILLRSPLYCKSKDGICPICYSKSKSELNSKHIGIIAGTAINQAALQGYAMKSRHKTSQFSLKSTNFVTDLINI